MYEAFENRWRLRSLDAESEQPGTMRPKTTFLLQPGRMRSARSSPNRDAGEPGNSLHDRGRTHGNLAGAARCAPPGSEAGERPVSHPGAGLAAEGHRLRLAALPWEGVQLANPFRWRTRGKA